MKTSELASAAEVRPAPAVGSRRPFLAVAALVVLTAAFFRPLVALGAMAWESDLFSYIPLIPVAVAYLIYQRAPGLPKIYECSWVPGALCLLLAAGAFAGSTGAFGPAPVSDGVPCLPILSYYLLLLATGFFVFGRRWMGSAAFPVFFLGLIVPLPDATVAALEYASQVGSSWAAAQAFALTDMPVFRQGFVFDLAGARIQVAQECSGLRSSLALFLSGLLAANLILRSNLHRALLLAVIIPIAMLRNGARIWFIGWLCVEYGPRMIRSAWHLHGGPPFFVLSLLPMIALLWWFVRREDRMLAASRKLTPAPASTL